MDRGTDIQTDRSRLEGWIDRWIKIQTYNCMHDYLEVWMGAWMGRWTGAWMGAWMGGWVVG